MQFPLQSDTHQNTKAPNHLQHHNNIPCYSWNNVTVTPAFKDCRPACDNTSPRDHNWRFKGSCCLNIQAQKWLQRVPKSMVMINQTKWRHILDDSNLNSHHLINSNFTQIQHIWKEAPQWWKLISRVWQIYMFRETLDREKKCFVIT
jgi:hypothetical protein